jgi:alkanesulfonate monooxygenase SsuD/methylene tetrahydromethanopterin reductase-like flavin-dependent oxidoreductase (luciferase family)
MTQELRFSITTLQDRPYKTLVGQWRYLDHLGFDGVWVADHFVYRDPHASWFDGWSLLAALAAQTERIRIGTLVTSMTLHNPAILARRAMTLDHISNGRLELGIGAAGASLDHTMTGSEVWPALERIQRFQEFVEIVDEMLRNPTTTYDGHYYKVQGAVISPRPVQQPRPPLTLAAHSPASLKIVATYADTWNSLGGEAQSFEAELAITHRRNQMLDEYCAELGRNPQTIRRSLLSRFTLGRPFASLDAFHNFIGRYREIGINDFIFAWMSEEWRALVPEGKVAFDRDTLERIATEAIPALRADAAGKAD